jgi:hypothetical protein
MATGSGPSDAALPENTRENLERKLDHAIEETFPTSDPVAVTITKGGAIDYDEHGPAVPNQGGSQGSSQPDTGEAIVTQAKEALSGAARTASEVAGEAVEQGRRYARQAAERFPQAARYSREGIERARSYAAEAPLLTAIVGFALGYALAWAIHSRSHREEAVLLALKRQNRARQRLEAAKGMSFKDCAERMMASHQAAWKNPKHKQQWRNTLASYAYPTFGDLPVGSVDTGLVLKALEPIWTSKPETAGRVRGRIEPESASSTARKQEPPPMSATWSGRSPKCSEKNFVKRK